MREKVLLGMSGGVDSSVAAMLLQDRGFEVIGITFMFGGSEEKLFQTANDASILAVKLGIKHIIADVRHNFKQTVEDYFIREYSEGKTPFPCAVCNPEVKFKYLCLYADKNSCRYISTGHYARVSIFDNKYYIFQGLDKDKDQSFFLWGLESTILRRLILPLGTYTKLEIRKFAAQRGFNNLSKR